MAFEGLSEKLQAFTRKLKGKARITESDLNEMLREVKLALLEADVNYKVVKEFINNNEDIYPGIKNNIMESFQKILTFESDIPSNLNECRLCGEPTSSDICKACELKKLISENHESHI